MGDVFVSVNCIVRCTSLARGAHIESAATRCIVQAQSCRQDEQYTVAGPRRRVAVYSASECRSVGSWVRIPSWSCRKDCSVLGGSYPELGVHGPNGKAGTTQLSFIHFMDASLRVILCNTRGATVPEPGDTGIIMKASVVCSPASEVSDRWTSIASSCSYHPHPHLSLRNKIASALHSML